MTDLADTLMVAMPGHGKQTFFDACTQATGKRKARGGGGEDDDVDGIIRSAVRTKDPFVMNLTGDSRRGVAPGHSSQTPSVAVRQGIGRKRKVGGSGDGDGDVDRIIGSAGGTKARLFVDLTDPSMEMSAGYGDHTFASAAAQTATRKRKKSGDSQGRLQIVRGWNMSKAQLIEMLNKL